MSVRVRLTRVGSKKNPIWRVVVTDQRSPRDGRFIEQIGHYNPRTEPSTIAIDRERLDHWIEQGAQPTNTVKKLMRAKPREPADEAPAAEEPSSGGPAGDADARDAATGDVAAGDADARDAAAEAEPEPAGANAEGGTGSLEPDAGSADAGAADADVDAAAEDSSDAEATEPAEGG